MRDKLLGVFCVLFGLIFLSHFMSRAPVDPDDYLRSRMQIEGADSAEMHFYRDGEWFQTYDAGMDSVSSRRGRPLIKQQLKESGLRHGD